MLLKTTYKDQIYEQLKIKIADRDLEPGKFYSEQFFADLFKVSRTPVREALLQLQNENYIEILPNRGARVVEFTMQNLLEMCQMRDAIESYCVFYLASHSASPDMQPHLQRLKDNVTLTLEKARELGNRPLASAYAEKLMNLFSEFNTLLVSPLNNGMFTAFYEKNAGRIVALDIQAAQIDRQLAHAADGHARILAAICTGDPVAAFRECHKHIDDAFYAIYTSKSKAPVNPTLAGV